MANVREFEDNINSYLQEIITENAPYIADMNATEQLRDRGMNALGIAIADYAPYAASTIEIKKAKGQPYDRVTLQDTGEFHASFYVDARSDEFEIMASDWKADDLARSYGKDIFGLTDANKREVTWDYVYPELLNKAKNVIYAGV